ncbi:MAG TPA: hypothetical protein VFQ61_29545 [Polyangiaceae bacterium]|nr:hypothetical protein [Polyangiaceae bacterium]
MRWFVEVSRVGEGAPAERYCVEAKAWQAALQETRKMRGDSGPLSKFSIELLDDGYRAVDPVQKIRYLVNQAPADAALNPPTPPLNGTSQHAAAAPSTAPDLFLGSNQKSSVVLPSSAGPAPNAGALFNAGVSPGPVSVPGVASNSTATPAPEQGKSPPLDAKSTEESMGRTKNSSLAQSSPGAAATPAHPSPAEEVAKVAATAGLLGSGGTPSVSALRAAEPVEPAEPAKPAEIAKLAEPTKVVESIAPRPAATKPQPKPLSLRPRESTSPRPVTVPPRASVPAPRESRESVSPAVVVTPSVVVAAPRIEPAVVKSAVVSVPPPRPSDAVVTPSAALKVLLFRSQDPRPDAPITYREAAYYVPPGTSRAEVERLLLDRLAHFKEELRGVTAGRLVQIALFDHEFDQRPAAPPLGTLAWKDWRGEPVLSFPAFSERSSVAPPSPEARAHTAVEHSSVTSAPSTASSSVAPTSEAHVSGQGSASSVSTGAAPAGAASPTAADSSAPAPAEPVGTGSVEEAAASDALTLNNVASSSGSAVATTGSVDRATSGGEAGEKIATENPTRETPAETDALAEKPRGHDATEHEVSALAPPSPAAAPEIAPPNAASESNQSLAPVPSEAPPATDARANESARPSSPVELRDSKPSLGSVERPSRGRMRVGRRRAGEDLISELFEVMHELHFAHDLMTGTDFLLGTLLDLIPCEVTMLEVFDINTRQFVVVRGQGGGASSTVLQRTSDTDPLVGEIMRRGASRVFRATNDARFHTGRFGKLTAHLEQVLCGPVRQGGRYLGLIELGNPLGGAPFHEGEVNALDYICQQYAEFVASRPVVLDSDVILGR